MLLNEFQKGIFKHWRVAMAGAISITVSACVGGGGNSSSSEIVTSSSEVIVTSSEVLSSSESTVSSVAISSITVVSSSEQQSSVSSSNVVISSSVDEMTSSEAVSSSIESASSTSSSMQSTSSSSSSEGQVPEARLIECAVPTEANIYTGGYRIENISITNSLLDDLEQWQVKLDFGVPLTSFNSTPQGLTTKIDGNVVIVSGSNLLANESVKFTLDGRTDGRASLPSCVASETIVTPPQPLEPDATGRLAKGWCAANSGLGVGSTGKGHAYAVLQSGRVINITGGSIKDFTYSGTTISDAVFTTNGASYDVNCIINAAGDLICGDNGNLNPSNVVAENMLAVSFGYNGPSRICGITQDGDSVCGNANGLSPVSFGSQNPYTYVMCSRGSIGRPGGMDGCCMIDSAGDVYCEDQKKYSLPNGAKALMISATDENLCAVGDDGLSYCWFGDQYGGSIGGDAAPELTDEPNQPINLNIAVTGIGSGRANTCWVTEAETVLCAGNGNESDGAGGTLNEPDQIAFADGSPLEGIIAVNSNRGNSCGTNRKGELFCWGVAGGDGPNAVKIDIGEDTVRLPLDCR